MAVPEEIRLIKRPKNTVVEDRGWGRNITLFRSVI